MECAGFAEALAVAVALNVAAYAVARRACWLPGVYLSSGLLLMALWAELSAFASRIGGFAAGVYPQPNVVPAWIATALFVSLVVPHARRDLGAPGGRAR